MEQNPELVRNILETELVFIEERHSEGQSIFETMGALTQDMECWEP